ncbi:uncharacterized protein ARMOST_16784 [Armillaria ostoyae]|uniref:Uncharacterized protein n=1 Tax=Armillaria ostoyae TaxID=47428 RepID=A0A284RX62_ARMOS|nr:uncharacterized protein ARMOST_16784 [Armillaria ostoyae]
MGDVMVLLNHELISVTRPMLASHKASPPREVIPTWSALPQYPRRHPDIGLRDVKKQVKFPRKKSPVNEVALINARLSGGSKRYKTN